VLSLHLTCRADEVEALSFQLWEAGTVGIREEDRGSHVELIAAFEDAIELASDFSAHNPIWEREEDTDWVAATEESWPAREVGERIFLAPVWNKQPTPTGRVRIIHNPGLASGTGEHPCTQLALDSLSRCVIPGSVVVDVGTGSGILSVAALCLGAKLAAALDLDLPSLTTARENFELSRFQNTLALGSAECISTESADIVVANISGTVLLSIADELLRISKPQGWLILTGFPESELAALQAMFGSGAVTQMNEWRCLTLRL
jgi:ribosomal protein L11 methyltransferase